MKIILISGKAQHGKDTSAEMLQVIFEKQGKKVMTLHYGDYVKFVARQYFGWNGEKDEKGRTLLQWLGTDQCRKNYATIWVDVVASLMKGLGDAFDVFMVPDTRFPDEITRVYEWFGKDVEIKSVRVNRINEDETPWESSLTDEQKKHISETALDGYEFDHTLVNVDNHMFVLHAQLLNIFGREVTE